MRWKNKVVSSTHRQAGLMGPFCDDCGILFLCFFLNTTFYVNESNGNKEIFVIIDNGSFGVCGIECLMCDANKEALLFCIS